MTRFGGPLDLLCGVYMFAGHAVINTVCQFMHDIMLSWYVLGCTVIRVNVVANFCARNFHATILIFIKLNIKRAP